jgi:hypothetical protein
MILKSAGSITLIKKHGNVPGSDLHRAVTA